MNKTLRPVRNYYRREILLDLPPGATFMFRQDNNMSCRDNPPAVFSAQGFDVEYTSADVIVVGNSGTNQYVLAGALTAFRSMSYFVLIRKATNMHSIEVRQPDVTEGETPEEIVVLEGSDWRKLLRDYADLCAEKMNVPKFDTSKNLTGYCTWYYYYASVTEKDLLENLEAMKNHQDSCYKAQVIQIDDGYQTFQGDWNDQDASWPTPLHEIGRRINDAGMTAGIWLMPFQASTASRVFKEHPDWFVKDENGQPKVAKGWSPPPDDMWVCLDATIPAVREHLANVFKTFQSWGYNYFKMDGLGFGLMAGRRSDPNATPVSAFRLGMEAIRSAVPKAHLLGCCPPFMPCLGYVDSARVSGDTHADWITIKRVMHEILSRFWIEDKFFRNDPDTIMARQDRSTATIGEARVSALGGILTGVSITSDNLSTISPERLEILGRAASLRLRDAQPLAWPEDGFPEVMTGTVDGKKAVALLNLDDVEKEFNFEDIALDSAKEAEELLQPMGKRKYVVTLKPHDAALLVQD